MTTNNRSLRILPSPLIVLQAIGQPNAKRRTELQCCHQLKKTSKLVFTDVGGKKVNCLLLGEDVLTVEVLSGTRTGGQTDDANATFSQPTLRCTEVSTV